MITNYVEAADYEALCEIHLIENPGHEPRNEAAMVRGVFECTCGYWIEIE